MDERAGGPRLLRRLGIAGAMTLILAVAAGAGLSRIAYFADAAWQTEASQPRETAPPAPTDPPPDVAETEAPGFPGRCDAEDVEVVVAGTDAATGARFLSLEARNTGAEACAIGGLPDLAFADEAGNAVRPEIGESPRNAAGDEVEDVPVQLEPGERVRADVMWRSETGRPEPMTLLAAPWSGAERTPEDLSLDIVDGGEITLTPWYSPEG